MVKKLLKHEFKDNYLNLVIINGITVVLGIVLGILVRTNQNMTNPLNITFVLGIVMMAYICFAIAALVILLMNIVQSFNSKLFSNQGYLTLTLPTSIEKIIFAKVIVNFVYYVFFNFSLLLSLVFMILIAGGINFEGINIGTDDFLSLGLDLVSLVTSVLSLITMILLILTLLNIGKIKKNKNMIGILIFIGFIIASDIIRSILIIIPYGVTNSGEIVNTYRNSIGIALNFNDLLLDTIFIILAYFGSIILIKKKLELE